jgi:GT2 family glycosyltransferase
MTASTWVRVVIVNYNGGAMLARAVDGLARQTCREFEAVIVDNGSVDGSIAACRLPDDRFSVIEAGCNLGFAAGCNLGARGATTEWLAMLNPDAVPEADWLAHLFQATRRHPEVALLGSTQLCADDPSLLDGAGDNYSIFGIAWRGGHGHYDQLPSQNYHVFAPCAAAAAYRRVTFESVGGFAESFFCYLEDVDLGFRLRLAGHTAMQVVDAVVHHEGSAISGRYSPFTIFHSARNGISLMIRCLPLPLLAIALPLHFMVQIWLALRLRGRGVSGARWSGLLAGLRLMPTTIRQRREIQRARRIMTGDVASLLVWNPRKLSRRAIVIL